jgi:uncharacterized protein YjiS (DUF1127 family)
MRHGHVEMNCVELNWDCDRIRLRPRAGRHRFAAWLDRLRARADLRQLDERMLRDIGVTPDWLENESTKPFWES